jgi:hypothetical protein
MRTADATSNAVTTVIVPTTPTPASAAALATAAAAAAAAASDNAATATASSMVVVCCLEGVVGDDGPLPAAARVAMLLCQLCPHCAVLLRIFGIQSRMSLTLALGWPPVVPAMTSVTLPLLLLLLVLLLHLLLHLYLLVALGFSLLFPHLPLPSSLPGSFFLSSPPF